MRVARVFKFMVHGIHRHLFRTLVHSTIFRIIFFFKKILEIWYAVQDFLLFADMKKKLKKNIEQCWSHHSTTNRTHKPFNFYKQMEPQFFSISHRHLFTFIFSHNLFVCLRCSLIIIIHIACCYVI